MKNCHLKFLLLVALLFTVATGNTYAETDNGTCGENVHWVFDSDNGSLLIVGNGAIADYTRESVPWNAYSSKIESVTIYRGITRIGRYAFWKCNNLKKITVPPTVSTVGADAFYNCRSLTAVNISDITSWAGIEFENAYANPLSYAQNLYLDKELVTSVVLPDGVTRIGSNAFYNCTSISTFTMPQSVTSLGDKALANCKGLKSVIIPSSVKTMGNSVFANCTGELHINCDIPNGKFIQEGEFFLSPFKDSRFTSIIIGDGVKSIGSHAFYNCSDLKNIVIPNSVKTIGPSAFRACRALASVAFPDGISTIGDFAFAHCIGLTSVSLSTSIKEIGVAAFRDCCLLSSITIPAGVTRVGDFALEGCISLESIVVDPANKVFDSRDNCNALIETKSNILTFGCKNTIIPNSVMGVDERAFY